MEKVRQSGHSKLVGGLINELSHYTISYNIIEAKRLEGLKMGSDMYKDDRIIVVS